ncbi:6663_t:CDS:2 [Funneliformis geosporum]|uniref:18275_t:CDS:1 n=1 Tax=Funneliformis geosporum TaxID=1117311 RepID=A0A9W4ST61_9GLOM|nr:18275_t:CDS:2 [Funneliformis geosporum]CAI2181434.1 6663_t:CDS:2 [Funneliformis geosporum]
MEPITAPKTITKINTPKHYPQSNSGRNSPIVAEASNSSSGSPEELEENGVITESEDILSTPPTGEEFIDEEDPFLLVSLRASKRSPPRPKRISNLYMFAFLDIFIITVCTIMLVHKDKQGYWHWKKAAWDWVALGLIRFMIVIGVASSKWIRELRWALGAYVVVTTDSRRRAMFLRDHSIIFEEDNSYADEDEDINRNQGRNTSSRSYGATSEHNDEIDVLVTNNNR